MQKEALRQQMLLRALWADARPGVVAGWLRDAPPRAARGLQAYRANAGALAERALTAAFPTVAQLVGEESFAALARALWFAQPPQRGDIGSWGEGLADFIAAAPQLADEPYLADVARLDWAVHSAEQAAERGPATGLERLAEADPADLLLRLAEGAGAVPLGAPGGQHLAGAPQRRPRTASPACARPSPRARARTRWSGATASRRWCRRCPRPMRASCKRCSTARRWRRRWMRPAPISPSTAGCCRRCRTAGCARSRSTSR